MNLGRAIVSEAIRSGSVKAYLDAGITADWMGAETASRDLFSGVDRTAWLEILDHHKKHGTVMSEDMFRDSYPEVTYAFSGGYKPSELLEKARDEVLSSQVSEMTEILEGLHEAGSYSSVLSLIQGYADRIQGGIKDTREFAVRVVDFNLQKKLHTRQPKGIPFGIPLIDDAFWGFQPSQLITLMGRQKAMKSTLMLNSAFKAWEDGKKVLFYSVELDITVLREILYSLGAGVSRGRFRRGDTKQEEKDKLEEFHKHFKLEGGDDFWVSNRKANVTMADLETEVGRYHPDVVYVDGFYFMKDSITGKSTGSDAAANENVAAALKALAMERGIVVVASTQAQEKQQSKNQKGGPEARSIMGGTGLLKASDLVLGCAKDDEGRTIVNEVFNRFGNVPDVLVTWDWETMGMSTYEWVDEEKERSAWANEMSRDKF